MQIIIHPGTLGPSFDLGYFKLGIFIINLILDFLANDLLNQGDELTVLYLSDGVECLIWVKYQISSLLALIKGEVLVKRPAWVLI